MLQEQMGNRLLLFWLLLFWLLLFRISDFDKKVIQLSLSCKS